MVVKAAVNISIVIIIIDTMRFTRACIMELGATRVFLSLLVLSFSFFFFLLSFRMNYYGMILFLCANLATLRCLVVLKYDCSNG